MSNAMRKLLDSKYFIWAVLSLPFAGMANGLREIELHYGEILHASGELSARLLLVTLAATPLRLIFAGASWPAWLVARRRYFGVAAFFYAALHTAVYLDRKAGSGLILVEAREFSMWTGWLAMLMFVPLALTSCDAAVRRLRAAWKKLHRIVYAAALLTFVHWIFAAFSFWSGLVHFTILLVLEGFRIWKRKQLGLSSATKAQD